MIEIVSALLYGILAGVVAGILPGIPPFLGFLVFLPLISIDPAALIVFAMVSNLGTQFFGSQAVLYYRIPGESSSYPVLMEAPNFNTPEKIYHAIQVTSWGSLVASLVGVAWLYLLLGTSVTDGLRISIEAKGLLYLLMVGIAIFSTRTYLLNILALVLFTAISYYEDISGFVLQNAIPVYYFNSMLGLIILFTTQPLWEKRKEQAVAADVVKTTSFNFKQWIPDYLKFSVVGVVFGIMPQLGATISSYISYLWAKWRNYTPIKTVAAAETANNSGILSAWVPLLLFGVPVTATEIIFIQYFSSQGFMFSDLRSTETVIALLVCLAIASIVFLAGALTTNKLIYQTIAKWLHLKTTSVILIFISLLTFYFANHYTVQFMLIHIAVFLPLSWIVFKLKVSMITTVIGLLLMNEMSATWYRLAQIHIL